MRAKGKRSHPTSSSLSIALILIDLSHQFDSVYDYDKINWMSNVTAKK